MPPHTTVILLIFAYAVVLVATWNRFFSPRLEWGYALVLLTLAIAPHLQALRPGFVFGPLDTNHPNLPWAQKPEDLRYRSRGGTLNDVTLQFVPWQEETRRQLLAGHVPLLNPHSAIGQPLLGNGQAAPFALTSLLSLPVDVINSQVLRSFLRVLIALAGAFLAARQLGVRPTFCLFAAVAYGYGGSLAVWRLFPHAEVMALWPFAYLAGEQVLAWSPTSGAGYRRSCALLFFALVGICLAGHPETAAMAGIALTGSWTLALAGKAKAWRSVARCFGLAVAALLATSFFTLPVAQGILGSEKLHVQGHGRDPSLGNAAEETGWASLINDATPGIFGTPQGSSEHGPTSLHWMAEGSVGLVSLALALASPLLWKKSDLTRGNLFLLGLGVICCFIFFNIFGVAGRFFALPLVSAVDRRYTGYLAGFAVALLAARSLEAWCTEPTSRRERLAIAFATVVALGGVWAAHNGVLGFWRSHGGLELLPTDALQEVNRQTRLGVLAALGLGSALALRAHARWLGALLILLTAGQLWSAYGRYTPTVDRREAMPRLAIVDSLLEGARGSATPFRLIGTRGVLFPNSSTFYGLSDSRSHDPTEWARYIDWLAEFVDLDRSTYKKQYRKPQSKHVQFLRLLGVKYLLSGADLRLEPPWIDRGLYGLTRLWMLDGPVRWAFFPAVTVGATDAATARQLLHGLDPNREASLESRVDVSGRRSNGPARVLGVKVDGDDITLSVAVEANAWVVVSQAAVPGWRASADGHSVPLGIADGALLAAYAPAGTKAIHLRFLPTSFLLGSIVSLLTVLVLALLLWHARGAPRETLVS